MFAFCTSLTNVTVGAGVAGIGNYAFSDCTNLTGVHFLGNAPTPGTSIFYDATNAVIYYPPGTTGWGATFGGQPAIQFSSPLQMTGFGVRSNRFGFTITGGDNAVIVVLAATSSTGTNWSAVGTNTLTGGSSYFNDSSWTNYPTRFYRLHAP